LSSRAGFESRLSGSNALVWLNEGTFFFSIEKEKMCTLQTVTFFELKALKLVIEKLETNTKIRFYW
jgi:hypothetical protein